MKNEEYAEIEAGIQEIKDLEEDLLSLKFLENEIIIDNEKEEPENDFSIFIGNDCSFTLSASGKRSIDEIVNFKFRGDSDEDRG